MQPLGAVITAGGKVSKALFAQQASPVDYPLQDEEPTFIKALLQVGGRTLLETALEAIWATQQVQQVVVVGNARLRCWLTRPGERWLPERPTPYENLIVGVEALREYPRVLYLTSDLPFVTAKAIRGFLAACPTQAGLCYAIVRREPFEQRFPQAPSTYARLKEGEFAAGCALLLSPEALLSHTNWIRQVAENRKSLWRLAALAGLPILWKYFTRQLSIADLEHRAQQLLGVRCCAVESAPELAYDIDTPQEYIYARRFAHERTG